jgi:hypothetical protein
LADGASLDLNDAATAGRKIGLSERNVAEKPNQPQAPTGGG